MSNRISLFIIVKNEEARLAKCIASARGLVNEVIVVDSYSKDKTVQIAKDLGAQVFRRNFDNFSKQKNFALSKVHGEWAINLDADESLSPQLKDEIRQAIKNTKHSGFIIPRTNYFLGKHMKHSGLNKERVLRLVRADKAQYTDVLVHEELKVEGSLGQLKNPIRHFPYDSLDSYFQKFNHYTTLAARQMHKNGRKFNLFFVLITIPFEFLKRYILKLGILDGMRGFIWASFSAFYVFVKYMKLWSLEQRKHK